MTAVAVIGAGAGGAAAVVELTLAGHDVRWWNRSPATIEPFRAAGGVRYEGVFGEGLAAPSRFASELPEALDGADLAMVCLPSLAHEAVALALAAAGVTCPVVLNPGHTGGALHVAELFRTARRSAAAARRALDAHLRRAQAVTRRGPDHGRSLASPSCLPSGR